MTEKINQLAECKKLIEQKLNWGNSNNWQSQDFDNLSELIFEHTKVLLSSSTLKRIWGKVRYDSTPNVSTLNALAQFAGFENWLAFTVESNRNAAPEIVKANKTTFKIPYKILLPVLGVVALATIFIAFKLNKKQAKQLQFENIKFTGTPVTKGLPNTVIFRYDASGSNADSVFIQQSWDPKRKYKVDKQQHEYASTYYLPGYYRAKLILNDSIVSEQDVYIETDGWAGMVEQKPIPVYFPDTLFKNKLEISKKDLTERKIDFEKEAPVFSFTKIDKQMNLAGDHISFSVALQNTCDIPNGICQNTSVSIFGTKGVIMIPLCKKGCVGEIGLLLGDKYIDGKTNDLTGFGVDFSREVKLQCETKNQQLKISVNDSLVYTGDFKQSIGNIAGAQIKFKGTGKVNKFELKEN